jgi:hypothetical protein
MRSVMSFPNCDAGHWAFTAVLDLDRFAPGLLGEVLRGSPARRQVICATLSVDHTTRLYHLYTDPLATEAVRYLNSCRGLNEEPPSVTPSGIIQLATLGSVFLKRELITRLGLPLCAPDIEHIAHRALSTPRGPEARG